MDEPLVIDVTAEIVGERREEWRDGFESGVKQGTSRVLQSDALVQMALGLKVHRAFNEAMAAAAHQRETDLASWKSEAAFWRAECERVSAEFSEFVAAMKRRLR